MLSAKSLFGFLLLAALLLGREWRLLPDGKFHAYFLDVGQGDATLIITPTGKRILVDGGPDLSTLEHLGRLLPFFERRIDLLVLTHPNLDHLTSFPEVLKRYDVRRFLFPGTVYDLGPYQKILSLLTSTDTEVLVANAARDFSLGDGMVLDVVWPLQAVSPLSGADPNDVSVVLRVGTETQSIILPGDIGMNIEERILQSGEELASLILKAPHHGSKGSSSPEFLRAVSPRLGIVSAGRNNRFGHPHKEAMQRYASENIVVRNTAEEGTIEIVWR